jgi:PAS domain S-box-containing protein
METDDSRHGDAAELRARAEKRAVENAPRFPENFKDLSPEETRRILYELRVHQIELEMQNEELRRAQDELDATRARYFDLYDLAPVGYCTLSETGQILEANLTATTLLGVGRRALVKQPITRFIRKEDQDVYYHHRRKLLATNEPQSFELRMLRLDSVEFWALLEAAEAENDDGERVFRVVMSDISTRKLASEALQEAFDQIKTLRGIVPICMHCKNIRDDQGFWNKVEVYVRDHSEAEFSHGICPKCAKEFYPDLKHKGERVPENEGGSQ